MTALVTGGGGFIGSHLVEYLLEADDETVLVLDDFSTGRPSNLEHVDDHPQLEIHDGDVTDAETVASLVEQSTTVYHLAAAVGVKKIVDNPLESMQTNVTGTENVLRAAARHEVPTFVASSSEVYGKSTDVPFSEDDDRVLGPTFTTRWGYASAKATDEFLALAYAEECDLPVVVGRFFNVVGPRQVGQYGMVIPTFVSQALSGEPITVYGDGTQTRSFAHVTEVVSVLVELMDTEDAYGDVFNVGSANPVSINELAERVLEVTESDSPIEHVPFEEVYGDDFEEPTRRYPDVSKLRETVGTVPDAGLDAILADVRDEQQAGDDT